MSTFEKPAADADEVQAARRALAHATRSIDATGQVYSVLGSLTSAVASLSQSLHQLGTFHDTPSQRSTWVISDSRTGRAAAYKVSWELHRAAEILHQVSKSIASAHTAESRVAYTHRDIADFTETPHRPADPGLSL